MFGCLEALKPFGLFLKESVRLTNLGVSRAGKRHEMIAVQVWGVWLLPVPKKPEAKLDG